MRNELVFKIKTNKQDEKTNNFITCIFKNFFWESNNSQRFWNNLNYSFYILRDPILLHVFYQEHLLLVLHSSERFNMKMSKQNNNRLNNYKLTNNFNVLWKQWLTIVLCYRLPTYLHGGRKWSGAGMGTRPVPRTAGYSSKLPRGM